MSNFKSHHTLDAKGLACPMPIVKTKKTMTSMQEGQVLEILATDKGSKADISAWANSVGHQYLGTIEEGDVLKHYLRKCSDDTVIEKQHPNVVDLDTLKSKLTNNAILVDVREEAEFAFGHIPGAISVPIGELDQHINRFEKDVTIYLICRTGKRSDLAAQKLSQYGFKDVWNVIPGMTSWTGQMNKTI